MPVTLHSSLRFISPARFSPLSFLARAQFLSFAEGLKAILCKKNYPGVGAERLFARHALFALCAVEP